MNSAVQSTLGPISRYRPISWEMIPDLGLYMEQVISLLKDYLDYMPPELKGVSITFIIRGHMGIAFRSFMGIKL